MNKKELKVKTIKTKIEKLGIFNASFVISAIVIFYSVGIYLLFKTFQISKAFEELAEQGIYFTYLEHILYSAFAWIISVCFVYLASYILLKLFMDNEK